MASVNLQGKIFEIPDEAARRLELNIEDMKRQAVERAAASRFHGKMVFIQLHDSNSDIRHRGETQSEYGPIYVVFRAVVNEQRSVLWMPNFSPKLEDIAPLDTFYPIMDRLILSEVNKT